MVEGDVGFRANTGRSVDPRCRSAYSHKRTHSHESSRSEIFQKCLCGTPLKPAIRALEVKAFLKGATYPLSAAISILEHDISSAWNVIKVGGSVREFSTCGRKDEDHDSTGKSWACFDSPYNAGNWLYVAKGQYGRGEAANRPEYAL